MKHKLLFTSIALMSLTPMALAQGRYGADSANCMRNLSLFMDYYRQRQYQDAYPFWAEAMQTCPPTASQNLYICGIVIMNSMIEKTTDVELRNLRIDSLLTLYDERMQYYPQTSKADVYYRKGLDMTTYRPNDTEELYKTFKLAAEHGREKTDPAALVLAMQQTAEMYKVQKLSAEKVMNDYTTLGKYIEAQVRANLDEKLVAAKRTFDNIFITSGVASCENLIPMFSKRFQESPEDKDLIRTIVQVLSNNDCLDNDLYVKVVEAYHRLEPSAGSAYALSKLYLSKNDYLTSIKFLRDAISQQPDSASLNSRYMAEMANIYYSKLNNVSAALASCREAISKDSRNGRAYILMGTLWATAKCTEEMDQKARFWVAVDYLQKARQVDPSLADDVSKSIGQYMQYFPTQAEAFMYTLSDGQGYTISCSGMTERTTVRTRK